MEVVEPPASCNEVTRLGEEDMLAALKSQPVSTQGESSSIRQQPSRTITHDQVAEEEDEEGQVSET